MPITVKLFKLEQPFSFSEGQSSVSSLEQLTLFEDEIEDAKTELTYLGLAEDSSYTKYLVNHDMAVKLEGRVFKIDFKRVLIRKTFPLFIKESRLLTAWVKGSTAANALKRLQNDNRIRTSVANINLPAAKDVVESRAGTMIFGAWFGSLKLDKVEVAYIYGPEIAESYEWEKYENAGELSCLQCLVNADQEVRILLTKDGSLVIYRNLNEKEYLELAEGIFNILEENGVIYYDKMSKR
jgi:hypothetical protein